MSEKRAVLVTTEWRAIFFGYTTDPKESRVVTLTNARNLIYWGGDKGWMRLADTGPDKGLSDRIGSRVPEITLQSVTSMVEVSEKAIRPWEEA